MRRKQEDSKKRKKSNDSSPIRVVELFAGVGGFRLGLEDASPRYKTVWFNQWEPAESDKAQYAWNVYCNAFNEDVLNCRVKGTNSDIARVEATNIPEHDLLVGGFPCQDYSVAKPLSQAEGIRGKKGVLWWEIHRIIEGARKKPSFLMLENVDRLLKSPSNQRGKDFAIMLATLSDLGYAVEWRVINAADYGMPQRRRRVYIIGYRKGTRTFEEVNRHMKSQACPSWLISEGVMARAFPVVKDLLEQESFEIQGEAHEVSRFFRSEKSPFRNGGVMIGRKVFSAKLDPIKEIATPLREILHKPGEVEESHMESFTVPKSQIAAWKRLKEAKAEERVDKRTGFRYRYTEGGMPFPDPLDRPSRTIVTGEGGATPSRFKHVVEYKKGKYRRLTPIELERLNMFPDNHTYLEGVSDNKRAFFMGNALVVGIVKRLGKELLRRIDD